MLLSKEISVELNHTGCRLKQFIAAKLRKAQVPLTPEQFMLIDLLWNHGAMSQQQLADMMKKNKFIENSDIEYWIFGHTHYNGGSGRYIGNTLMLCNQLGYTKYGENKSFLKGGGYIEVK